MIFLLEYLTILLILGGCRKHLGLVPGIIPTGFKQWSKGCIIFCIKIQVIAVKRHFIQKYNNVIRKYVIINANNEIKPWGFPNHGVSKSAKIDMGVL